MKLKLFICIFIVILEFLFCNEVLAVKIDNNLSNVLFQRYNNRLDKNIESSQKYLNLNRESQIDSHWVVKSNNAPNSVIVPIPANVNYFSLPDFMMPDEFVIYSDFKLPEKIRYIPIKFKYTKDKNVANVTLTKCNKYVTICNFIKDKNEEGYVMLIGQYHIDLFAYSEAGAYYAYQSFRQLAFADYDLIPNQLIVDYPRFRYRGMMLDTTNKLIEVDKIKEFIDIMGANKLNVLHLNLSNKYTAGNVKEIISYANSNYINVIADFSNSNTAIKFNKAITNIRYKDVYGCNDTYGALMTGAITNESVVLGQVIGIEGGVMVFKDSQNFLNSVLPQMSGIAEASWSNFDKLNWVNFASRLGDGKTGFLSFLFAYYNIKYEGYPDGIKSEIPASAKLLPVQKSWY